MFQDLHLFYKKKEGWWCVRAGVPARLEWSRGAKGGGVMVVAVQGA